MHALYGMRERKEDEAMLGEEWLEKLVYYLENGRWPEWSRSLKPMQLILSKLHAMKKDKLSKSDLLAYLDQQDEVGTLPNEAMIILHAYCCINSQNY